MGMHDDIQVYQTLFCNNGESVVVMEKTNETLTVKYKEELHTRPLSIIGDKLHVQPPLVLTNVSQESQETTASYTDSNNPYRVATLSNFNNMRSKEEVVDACPACFQCMLNAREECFGQPNEICEQFVLKPAISRKEKEHWPEYGDASAYRFGEHRND